MPLKENINPLEGSKIQWSRIALYFIGVIFVLLASVAVGTVLYLNTFADKVYPGVSIGSQYMGGKNHSEIKNILENFNDKIFKDGLVVILPASHREVVLDLNTDGSPDNAIELIKINSEETAQQALSIGRHGSWWQRAFWPLYYRWFGYRLPAVIQTDRGQLLQLLSEELAPYGVAPNDANIKVESIEPLKFTTIEEQTGNIFDYSLLESQLANQLSALNLESITATEQVVLPTVIAKNLPDAAKELPIIFSYGDVGLNYVDGVTQTRKDWKVSAKDYASWLEVQKNGDQFVFGLAKTPVYKYLESLVPEVERQAEDAKFTMEGNKVKEFQVSRSGVTLNLEKTYTALNQAFLERNYHPGAISKTISLAVDLVEPQIKLSTVNNLGITDIIGSGTSTFYGSHAARIKNIGRAVAILNGTIIKPGEEFSTVKSAGPFVEENGYFPELVIKGDRIKREVGGGMCQIGTTLFRMAMNSGMPITERRNHSLVVNYYLDPENHNPGTDATVYDPVVDFKFLNDTGNFLLLQTQVDYKKQLLTFTLWGKPDGRRGYYSKPLVKKWIPSGAPRKMEVDDLAPGVEECQELYTGAVASFIYTRFTSSSEEIKQVFDSYYRPLPKICRVGKTEASTCPKGQSCMIQGEAVTTSPEEASLVPD